MNRSTIYLSKVLITVIITLVLLIIMKSNAKFKSMVYDKVYNDNFTFNRLNNIYKKYISKISLDNIVSVQTVFNEKLEYSSIEKYKDGALLKVGVNYLVPIQESGVVVFIGNKEDYGNTVIIQRVDGIDEWYGNVDNVNVEMYDYVKKGTLLGEANEKLYLVYKSGGTKLNYEEYIK